jgi:hypothetical protein
MYRSKWGAVSNTKVSYDQAVTRNPVASGKWTYDSSMNSWGASKFDSLTPLPTDAYLKSIWK